MTRASAWTVERRRGPASALHAIDPPTHGEHTLWVNDVEHAALVLGSRQDPTPAIERRAVADGLDIVRRRSGGGSVLLVPGDHVWVDLWVPRGSPRWDDDVVAAADWVGRAWIDVARGVGLDAVDAHRGAMVSTAWSDRVCFAGLGPGEVSSRGRKLVGVSQRRSRDWARFQCVAYREWDAARSFAPFADDADIDDGVVAEWRDRVAVLPATATLDQLVDALLEASETSSEPSA